MAGTQREKVKNVLYVNKRPPTPPPPIPAYLILPNVQRPRLLGPPVYSRPKSTIISRSSHRRCSIKKAVLKNLAIFTGKHPCWNVFLIKLQNFRTATLLKGNSNAVVFL